MIAYAPPYRLYLLFYELNTNLNDTTTWDTYIPVSAGDGILPGTLYIDISNARSTLHRRYRMSQTASGPHYPEMPGELQGKTCILYRSVHISQREISTTGIAGHALVQMLEGYPVAGRIWINFYNYGTWTGWKCVRPS